MLILSGLGITIGHHVAVRSASLTVQRGESVALVGASGSGKSLTAAALGGYLPPRAVTTGGLTVDGTPASLSSRRRDGVVSVRQDSLTALHPLVRIDRQLLPKGRGPSSSNAMNSIPNLLSEVGFADPGDVLLSYSAELSGGQRQRVCLVQALATSPRFIIADEPTTALDTVSTSLVLAALGRAASAGAGVLFITHDLAAAAVLCSRAVVLADGVTTPGGTFVPADTAGAQHLPAGPNPAMTSGAWTSGAQPVGAS